MEAHEVQIFMLIWFELGPLLLVVFFFFVLLTNTTLPYPFHLQVRVSKLVLCQNTQFCHKLP